MSLYNNHLNTHSLHTLPASDALACSCVLLQMVGLRWMVSLYNNHLNGILADEMGLGWVCLQRLSFWKQKHNHSLNLRI